MHLICKLKSSRGTCLSDDYALKLGLWVHKLKKASAKKIVSLYIIYIG